MNVFCLRFERKPRKLPIQKGLRDLSFEKKLWVARAQMDKGVSKTQSCFFYLAVLSMIIMMYL